MAEFKNHLLELARDTLDASPPGGGRLRGKAMMDLHLTTKPLRDALEPFVVAKQAIFSEYGSAVVINGQMMTQVPDKIDDPKNEGKQIPNPRLGAFNEEHNEILNAEVEFKAVPLPAYLLDLLEFGRAGFDALLWLGILGDTTEAKPKAKPKGKPRAKRK